MTSIFNNENSSEPTSPQAEPNQSAPSTEPSVFEDKLKTITTEDGKPKYDTVDKALDALANAQSHIPKVENENAELRQSLSDMMAKVEKVSKLAAVVDRLNSTNKVAVEPQSQNVDAEDLSETVNQILDNRTKAEQTRSNETQVSEAMRKKYGDKVNDVLAKKAEDLGVGLDYLQNTARTSPKMFMQLFGETHKEPTVTTNSHQSTFATPPPRQQAKSLMSGATTKDLLHEMAALKADVKNKYGIE